MPDHSTRIPSPNSQPTADPALAGSVSDAVTTTHTGDVLGTHIAQPAPSARYKLGDEIARGGMGVIYQATDSAFGRDVAVKVLQDKFGIASMAAHRFFDEARITGQLQHPAIPPAHDVGTLSDGRPFLAMKLIKGDTLEALLASRPDPSAERGRFVAAFEQVCQAVAYAHDHRVIHRDLKPANVMVGNYGEVQVMDWGLAKKLGSRTTRPDDPDETASGTEIHTQRDSDIVLTQAGSILGTPAFMPPEQAIGAIDQVDERSDVFGLGGILCVTLTGRPPFVGDTAESTRQAAAKGKVMEAFARLDACGADPELVALCKRCLAAEKDDRPANAGEVALAVANLRAAADERARRAELDRVKAEGEKAAVELKSAELRKRRRVQLLLAGAIGILMFGIGSFAWWADRQATDRKNERDRAEMQRAQELMTIEADREARQIRISDSVASALGEARSRAEEAWGQADEPERMRAAVDLTQGALRRAEGFTVDRELTPEVLKDLLVVRSTVADLNRHARLFLTADRALQNHAQSSFGPESSKRTAQRLADAFQEYGWLEGQLAPDVVADAVVASRVRNQLLGYMGEWAWQNPNSQWVKTILQISRHRAGGTLDIWQSIRENRSKAKLVAFAASPGALEIGPEQICQLGVDLDVAQASDDRLALLRRGVERYPKHVWLRYNLLETCQAHSPPLHAEALQHAAAVAAIRPDSTVFQTALGAALSSNGAPEPAEAAYRRAIKLDAKNAVAHCNLGLLLMDKGDPDGAALEYSTAIQLNPLDPRIAAAHINVATLLARDGKEAEAEAEIRKAIKLDPKSASAHVKLGVAMMAKGNLAEAEVEFQIAMKLDPKLANAHIGQGFIMEKRGNKVGAEASFKIALQLDPKNVYVQLALAKILEQRGALEEAITLYRMALGTEPKNAQALNALPRTEKSRDLYRRLPDILTGTAKSATPLEEYEFASLCGKSYVKQYAASVRLFENAFTADPKLADRYNDGRRYNPACYALRAARGDGIDAPGDPTARAALRAKALAWLRTDLSFYKSQVISLKPSERGVAISMLSTFLVDSDLSSVRPGLLRIGMSAEERAEWDALWTDVRVALSQAQKPSQP